MKLIPQSILGRTVLVLLLGLSLSHLISLSIYSSDRSSALTAAGGRRVAERIAGVARMVEEAPPGMRHQIVRSHWGPGFSVTLSSDSLIPEGGFDWRARRMRSVFSDFLGEDMAKRSRIRHREIKDSSGVLDAGGMSSKLTRGPMAEHMSHMREMWPGMMGSPRMRRFLEGWHGGQIVEVSVPVSDGTWLNFAAPFALKPFWASRLFWSLLLMTVAVIGLSIWAVRRSTAPLALFAQAAERLGRDVKATPMTEEGPREVRRAAVAFNEMQRRISGFVEDRTRMLAAISHDLRTPITRLRLRAEFIEDRERREKTLADLEEMEKMIAATLNFARDAANEEESKSLDLAALLQALCSDATDAGGKAEYAGSDRLTFTGRPVSLKRAFGNLIDNANNYGHQALVRLDEDQDKVIVTIEDDGPGIDDADKEKVFRPFVRLEGSRSRETGGVGLGMAVARSIVHAHGGEIALEDRTEGGLRITVNLPRG